MLTDEIYEHLVYGGAEHHSMPVLVPELADRCLVANGVAKTYAMTGWRVGWLIGPTDAITAATNIQSHETSNVSNVAQRAALAAVSGGLEDVRHDAGGVRPAPPARSSRCSTRSTASSASSPRAPSTPSRRSRGCSGGPSGDSVRRRSAELAELCINEAKVAVVPGEAFGAPGYFRMSYALADDDLVEGVSRLAALFAEAQD